MTATRYLVLAGLLVAGSFAHAAPRHRRSGAAAKVPSHADIEADTDGDADSDAKMKNRLAAAEEQAAPKEVTDSPQRTSPSAWRFAVGPYVWASSVQANVSFGPLITGVDVGFISLARHTRYGAEAIVEARWGRFGIAGDIMYGAAAFGGSTEIASVMTSITGTARSLLVDSTVSYELVGGDAALFSLEGRSGVRYQDTTIQGEVGVGGFTLQTPEFVDAGTDVLLGARAALRPTHSLLLAGAFDVGIAGASDSTWSATLDASLRVASWLSLTAGWRSLTMRRPSVNIQLRGPRVALQFLF